MVPQIELIGVDEELRGRVEGIVTLQLGSSMSPGGRRFGAN
jgi:hypothetical protein